MLRLARYLKYYKLEVIFGPVFKLLEAIFELIVPLVMASIIDDGIRNGDKSFVLQKGGIILLLGVAGLIFALICQYSAARASQGFGTRVRNELFVHINTLSHTELDQLGTNMLITVITNDVNQLQLAVAMLIRLVVRAPFLVVGASVMAMLLDLKLSLIFFAVAPVIAFLLYIIMQKSVPFYRSRQKVLDKISLITRENLTGARVIRAFSREEKEEGRFEEANEEAVRIAVRVGKLSALLNPAIFALMNLAVVAIIWFGGIRVEHGGLSQGEIIALINYMTQISLALVVVANLVIIFTKAAASAGRINRVFDMTSSMVGGKTAELPEDAGEKLPFLSVREVSFAYPGAKEYALEKLSFEIEEGETVGIIGSTGSGKSTLIQLLLRLYDTSEGEILLKGLPLREYSFAFLRRIFGIAPQKAVLFSGSIRDNLRMAKEDASEEELIKAVRLSQAEEFVFGYAEGLDYRLEQEGKNLSGGQRQRLTIARALAGAPEILILDDSLSALDYATDAGLRRALREECRDMTIIMVSQRAGTILHADKIIVMEDGRIAGIGSHRELLRQCEVYREICLSQFSEEEVSQNDEAF